MFVKCIRVFDLNGTQKNVGTEFDLVPDEEAERLIKLGCVIEIKDYSTDEVKQLFKEFKEIKDFKKKVEFQLQRVYQKYQHGYNLYVNGERIIFDTKPHTPEENYIYNTLHIEYFKKTDYRCSIEGRIEEFNKKIKKAPIKQEFIENELNIIKEFINRLAYHKSICDIYHNNDWDLKIKNYYNDTINCKEIDLYKNNSFIYFYLIGQSLALYKKFLLEYKDQPEKLEEFAKPKLFTYKCSLSPEQLTKLYICLKDGGYIAPETTPEAFLSVFNDELIESIIKPVKWIDTAPKDKNTLNKQTIFTLLNKVIPELTKPDNVSNLYDFIINRFIDGNGNKYKRNLLKQSYKDWNKNIFSQKLSERKSQLILIIQSL